MKKFVPLLTIVVLISQLFFAVPVSMAANEWTVVRGDPVNYSETGSWNVSASLNALPGGAVKAATQKAALGDGTATFQLPADAPAGSYAIYYYAPAKTGSYNIQVNGTDIPFLFSSYYRVSAWQSDTQGAYLRLGGENYTFQLTGDGKDFVKVITNGASHTAHSSSVKFIRVGDPDQGPQYYINSECDTYSALPNETQPWPVNNYMYRDNVVIDKKSALRLHYEKPASATEPQSSSQSTLPLLYPSASGRVVFDTSFRIDHIADKNALLFRDGATNGIIAHIDFTSKKDGIHLNYYDGSTKATQSSSGTVFHEEQWYRMILVFDTTKPAYDIYCYDEENHRVEAVTGVKPKVTTLTAGNCSVHKIDIQLYHTAGQAIDTTMYFDYIKLFDGAGFEVPQGTPVIPTPDPGPFTFQRIELDPANAVGQWKPTTSFPDSTGALGKSLYSSSAGAFVEYPTNLVPGWYDLYFWNLVYQDHQNPMKMTATVFANNQNRTGICLPVNTTSGDREGRWDKIGTYYFAGGEGEYVRLVASGGDYARPSDIKLVQNSSYVPPISLSQGVTIANFDTDFPIETTPGYFKVYVQGEPGSYVQIDLAKNGAIVGSNLVTFNDEWNFFGSYKFDDFENLNFEQDILIGDTGLNRVKFEYYVPDKLIVENIHLYNESLGRAESYMQAGFHTVTADITPVNTQSAMMVLALLEGGRLKETTYTRLTDLKAGETVTMTAGIPVTSVSADTVLKVMFWDSLLSLAPLEAVKTYYADRKETKAPFFISSAGFEEHMGTWSYSSDSAALSGQVLMGKTSPSAAVDATVEVNARKAGTYRLWVRSKNFASDPGSRYFNVKVNGTPLEKTFGQVGTDGFIWEDGGEISLAQGANEIAVVDSSCHYARLDAIYITQGRETPSDSYQELAANATLVSKYCSSMTAEEMMMDFHITEDFSGGNVKVLAKNNNIVTISPDLSDTSRTDWFYWNFKATSDTARTVTFKFDSAISAVLNSTGVVYSLDNGQNWNYLTDYKSPQREFKYEFEPGQQVWLSVTLPYVEKDLTDYIDTIKDQPRVTVSTLCQSEEGRDVPLIVVGDPSAPKSIVFTSRHHCCEATTSYLLEGAIDYLAAEADEGIFDEYCFYIVPMVDIDGVENGDQGKDRIPHDHNRDYVAGLYAPVRAIKELVAEKEIEVAIDFHCPYIPNKMPYLYLRNGAETEINKFGTAMVNATRGDEIYYDKSKDFAAGDYYPQNMAGWFALNKTPRLSTSFEFPYAGGDEVEYTPSNIRKFGRKTMIALLDYLYQQ